MDLGTDRVTGPVWDARPPAKAAGPPWRPWWAHCSSGKDVLRWVWWSGAATYFTFNGTLARHSPFDPVIPALVVLLWIYSLIGVVGFWRRPDLSRLPPRPWTRPAGTCAAIAALLLVVAFAVHLSANSSGAQWIAVVLALPAVPLFVAAAALNNRPALAVPLQPGTDLPGPPV